MTQTLHRHRPPSYEADGPLRTAVGPVRLGILDRPLMVAGVAALLAPYDGRVEVYAPAAAWPEAAETGWAPVQQARALHPPSMERGVDVLLVDLTQGCPGVRAPLDWVTAQGTKVISFGWGHGTTSAYELESPVGSGAGCVLQVEACIFKGEVPVEIVRVVEGVHARRHDLAVRTTDAGRRRGGNGCAKELTPREHDVLSLIAEGHTNIQIAAELYLSINSVKSYIRSCYGKIGVTRRSEAVRWALLPPHPWDVTTGRDWSAGADHPAELP